MQLGVKAYQIIADELQKQIQVGILKPGEKIDTIEALAKAFRVSRSTIREALGHLKAIGLVQSIQGGGTYVSNDPVGRFAESSSSNLTNPAQLQQLLQVRQILEIGSIQLAAQHRNTADLEELARIVDQMRSSIGNEEMSLLHDVNFHLAIAKASHNSLLGKLMDSLSETMVQTMRDSRKLWLYREAASAKNLFMEHERMYQAIVDQSVQKASKVMKQHLYRVAAAFE